MLAPSKDGTAFGAAQKVTLEKWHEALTAISASTKYDYHTEMYRNLMVEAGFFVDSILYEYNTTEHSNRTALTGWVKQWHPVYKALPADQREPFMTELVANYLERSGQSKREGAIQWGEYTTVFWATKPIRVDEAPSTSKEASSKASRLTASLFFHAP